MALLHLILFFSATPLLAKELETGPQVLPAEFVEDSPLDVFSLRTSLWPSSSKRTDVSPDLSSSVFDSLQSTPGIQSSEQGSPLLSIRGSGSNARVLGLYDGVPLNFSDGMGVNTLLVPLEAVQTTTLIKGPGSVFYGSDAMAGIIQWNPKRFTRPLVKLGARSFGGREFLFATPLLQGSNKDADHQQISYLHDDSTGNFEYQSRNGVQGVRERNDRSLDRATLQGSAHFGSVEVSNRLIFARDIGSTPGSLTLPNATTFNRQAGLASITLSDSATDALAWNYRLSHSRYVNLYRDEPTFSDSKFEANRTHNSLSIEHALSEETSAEYFLEHTYDEAFQTYDGITRFAQSLEGGGILHFTVDKTWSVQPGLRYISSAGRLLKSLGVTETLGTKQIWLTYADGFRTPAVSQLYGETSYYVGNRQLSPEISKQWEAGFLLKNSGWSYGLSIFSIDYEDLMQYVPLNGTQFHWANEGSAQSRGLEAQVSTSFSHWTAEIEYSKLETKVNSTGRAIRVSPEDQISALVSYQFGPLIFQAKDTYWGSYWNQGASWEKLGPWNTVDVGVRSLGFTNWNFQTGILNVFDVPREISIDYPEPQRRWYISAERLL